MATYRVFPYTSGTTDGTAFVTEYNLSSLIAKLLSVNSPSFVITDKYQNDGNLEFNIGGYYFSVTGIDEFTSNGGKLGPLNFTLNTTKTELKATITLVVNSTLSYSYILSEDSSDNQENDNDTASSKNEISLVLLTRKNSSSTTWEIPYTSRLSFNHIHIDDGEL